MDRGVPLTDPPAVRPPAARVARNAGLRVGAEVLSKITSIALFVVVARHFSNSTLGSWVFALAVVQLLWPIAGFGLDRVLIRDVSQNPAALDRLFYPMVWIKVTGNLLGLAIVLPALVALDYSDLVLELVLIIGISQCFAMAMTTVLATFVAGEQMEYYFLARVPRGIFGSLIGICIIWLGGGLVALAINGLVLDAITLAYVYAILYRRFARPRFCFAFRTWRSIYRVSFPLGIQEIIGQVIFRIDAILLSLLATSAVVGIYGAGYRMLEATLFLAWSVGGSVLPMYSYLQRESRPPLRQVFEGSLKFALVILTPVGVALLVCARPIVDLFYGLPKFDGTVPVLRWLALAAVVYPIGYLSGELVAVRRPGRFVILSSAAVAVFNIVINLALIPVYGAAGAAAATFASEVLLALLGLTLARTETGTPRFLWMVGPPAIAGAVMGAAMVPFSDSLLLALPIGAGVYLGALALTEGRELRSHLKAIGAAVRGGGSPWQASPERVQPDL